MSVKKVDISSIIFNRNNEILRNNSVIADLRKVSAFSFETIESLRIENIEFKLN